MPEKSQSFYPSSDSSGLNIALNPQNCPIWIQNLVAAMPRTAGPATAGPAKQVTPTLATPTTAVPAVEAAVLVLLTGGDAQYLPADAAVLLTHRTITMRSHAGQIAFPGGRIDSTDISPVDAALREAWEETGLNRLQVTPAAQLRWLKGPVRPYPIHPVVAYAPHRVAVTEFSPTETDHVFYADIAKLLAPENRFTVQRPIAGGRWHGPAFMVDGYLVWGFTATILDELIRQAGWEIPWDKSIRVDLAEAERASRNFDALS
ncbi:NUDIX hydrolase [Corynebacterium caspium]|uniref:NUDIX hydrolase n=1 Tax=Corynebacterium caspium TaxID=234828 RepID=UPI0003621644|nr:CoA pyrophosphatase [Corynebacterium caspium]WKD58567.1 putative NUDIX hydrolase [Corynebacterium caspium DSM 44850]